MNDIKVGDRCLLVGDQPSPFDTKKGDVIIVTRIIDGWHFADTFEHFLSRELVTMPKFEGTKEEIEVAERMFIALTIPDLELTN